MAEKGARARNVLPIFIKEEAVDERCRVVDMCRACESVCGKGSIDGATKFNRLWRILPYNETSRAKLLTNGVSIFGKRAEFEASNPYVSSVGGGEALGTKMTISGLPFSYSMEAVERNLVKVGFKPRSKLTWMKARDRQGHMTDWRDGRRVVWVEVPDFKHSNKLQMGSFSAFIYYKEMPVTCFRCKEEGHTSKDCTREVLCFVCKKPGHKKGDPACTGKPQARRKMVWDLNEDTTAVSSEAEDDSESECESLDRYSLRGNAPTRGRGGALLRGGTSTRGGASFVAKRYTDVVSGTSSTLGLENVQATNELSDVVNLTSIGIEVSHVINEGAPCSHSKGGEYPLLDGDSVPTPSVASRHEKEDNDVSAGDGHPVSVSKDASLSVSNNVAGTETDNVMTSAANSASLSVVSSKFSMKKDASGQEVNGELEGISLSEVEASISKVSIHNEANAVNKRHKETTTDVDSPMSDFFRNVEFAALPGPTGKELDSSKANAGNSDCQEQDLITLWDPLDSEELLLAANMAEGRTSGTECSLNKSPTPVGDQVTLHRDRAVAREAEAGSSSQMVASITTVMSTAKTVVSNSQPQLNAKSHDQQNSEAGATVSGFVSVGKRVFRAILSPTEGKKEKSREPKLKKK